MILPEIVSDDKGQCVSGTLMDDALPTSQGVPAIEDIILEEAPSPLNPLGVKGAGKRGIVATGAALAKAVSHALAPLGIQVTALPRSPNHMRSLIAGQRV